MIAPVRAKARPPMLAPVARVTLAAARVLPTRFVVVPSAAELPTCQNTGIQRFLSSPTSFVVPNPGTYELTFLVSVSD